MSAPLTVRSLFNLVAYLCATAGITALILSPTEATTTANAYHLRRPIRVSAAARAAAPDSAMAAKDCVTSTAPCLLVPSQAPFIPEESLMPVAVGELDVAKNCLTSMEPCLLVPSQAPRLPEESLMPIAVGDVAPWEDDDSENDAIDAAVTRIADPASGKGKSITRIFSLGGATSRGFSNFACYFWPSFDGCSSALEFTRGYETLQIETDNANTTLDVPMEYPMDD